MVNKEKQTDPALPDHSTMIPDVQLPETALPHRGCWTATTGT